MIYKDRYLDSSLNKTIGIELKKARELKHLSLEDLSNKLDNKVSRQTLSTYESGRSKIRISTYFDICNALDVNPYDFFDYINTKYIKNAKL